MGKPEQELNAYGQTGPQTGVQCAIQVIENSRLVGKAYGATRTDPGIYRTLGGTPRSFLAEDDACAYAARLRLKLAALNEGRPSKHSAISQGVYEIHVLQAANLPLGFPETRPRYE